MPTGVNYMGGRRNAVKRRANSIDKVYKDHFRKRHLDKFGKIFHVSTNNEATPFSSPKLLQACQRQETQKRQPSHLTQSTPKPAFPSTPDNPKTMPRKPPHDYQTRPNDLSFPAGNNYQASTSSVLEALDTSEPILLRGLLDRILQTPDFAGLAKPAKRVHNSEPSTSSNRKHNPQEVSHATLDSSPLNLIDFTGAPVSLSTNFSGSFLSRLEELDDQAGPDDSMDIPFTGSSFDHRLRLVHHADLMLDSSHLEGKFGAEVYVSSGAFNWSHFWTCPSIGSEARCFSHLHVASSESASSICANRQTSDSSPSFSSLFSPPSARPQPFYAHSRKSSISGRSTHFPRDAQSIACLSVSPCSALPRRFYDNVPMSANDEPSSHLFAVDAEHAHVTSLRSIFDYSDPWRAIGEILGLPSEPSHTHAADAQVPYDSSSSRDFPTDACFVESLSGNASLSPLSVAAPSNDDREVLPAESASHTTSHDLHIPNPAVKTARFALLPVTNLTSAASDLQHHSASASPSACTRGSSSPPCQMQVHYPPVCVVHEMTACSGSHVSPTAHSFVDDGDVSSCSAKAGISHELDNDNGHQDYSLAQPDKDASATHSPRPSSWTGTPDYSPSLVTATPPPNHSGHDGPATRTDMSQIHVEEVVGDREWTVDKPLYLTSLFADAVQEDND
ncbi:hypothetical protein FISHEDRAFT_70461 [Fistulina hepatica ATCC 64428]|uniref:Uncharacterized protein n=1 Tax=Fistulina hepatica ATCC 64428 TaxID=1128425 RepID=A0A0D7ALS5_9AGAR|nr:hypothetical protein FISHEDRAFT_70461 [Fistulina hepatica ATCC 64428]